MGVSKFHSTNEARGEIADGYCKPVNVIHTVRLKRDEIELEFVFAFC